MTHDTQHAWQLHISREGVVRERNNTGTRPTGEPIGYVEKASKTVWRARDHEHSLLGIEDSRTYAVQRVLAEARKRWRETAKALLDEQTS